jgi:hypothetical protein
LESSEVPRVDPRYFVTSRNLTQWAAEKCGMPLTDRTARMAVEGGCVRALQVRYMMYE